MLEGVMVRFVSKEIEKEVHRGDKGIRQKKEEEDEESVVQSWSPSSLSKNSSVFMLISDRASNRSETPTPSPSPPL